MLKQFLSAIYQYIDSWAKVISFARYFRPIWRRAILANTYGGVSSSIQLFVPLAMVTIINEAIPNKDFRLLANISLLIVLAILVSMVSSYLEFYNASIFRERAGMMLELHLFEHLQNQPYLFFKNYESGYIMSRVANDSKTAVEIVASMATIGRTIIWLLSGIILLPFFSLKLGILIISIMPIYFILLLWFNNRAKLAFKDVQEKTALVSRELFESLTGIHEIKAYNVQKYHARRYAEAMIGKTRVLIKARILTTLGSQVTQILTLLVSIFIITYGGYLIMAGHMTLGAMIGINALAAYLLLPINRIVQQSLQAQQSLAAIERVKELLMLPREELSKPTNLLRSRGYIRFENVSYSYDHRLSLLRNINFEVLPGEVALIAGPSGIGKTTLANLLPRFLEPTTGTIYLDGLPITDLTLRYLRHQIAFVSQDTFLFSDSIYDNIRMGNRAVSEEEVREAARLANALEFIEQLPEGFNTQVGERGARLSGGQRQRISIARALIRNAPILVLDEATSAVDTDTEASVHEALCHLMKDRTTIIIAHHTDAFIEYVDKLFVLEDGILKLTKTGLLVPPSDSNFMEHGAD